MKKLIGTTTIVSDGRALVWMRDQSFESMPSTRYWIDRDPDGKIAHLVRIRDVPGEGLWTEYFRMGHWNDDPAVYRYLMDPLLGDEISREEAQAAVQELGYEWREGRERDPDLDNGPER